MSYWKWVVVAGAAILSVSRGEVLAADIAVPPPDSSDWVFTGAAYLWGAGVDGKAGLFGFPPQDVNASFSDVLENLDMALMGAGEARNGPFSIGMDVAYVRLETNVGTPFGVAASDVDVTAETFMGTGVLGYALFDGGSSHLDAIAGARVWSVNTDFDFNGGALNGKSASDGASWIDPLVGAKFTADLGSDFYVSGWGMIGGFGVSSDLMWDVMAGVGYQFNDSFSIFGGYRAVSVDYKDGGFVYDIVQKGPIFAGVFRF